MHQFYLLIGNACYTYCNHPKTLTSHIEEDRFTYLSLSRFLTESSDLSEEATGIIEASWRFLTR